MLARAVGGFVPPNSFIAEIDIVGTTLGGRAAQRSSSVIL
jgi:hypothetical protein